MGLLKRVQGEELQALIFFTEWSASECKIISVFVQAQLVQTHSCSLAESEPRG